MRTEVWENVEEVADSAAEFIAREARAAVATRGRFLMAVSGGHTPWLMLGALAAKPVPWDHVHIFQVDERVAPAGDPNRNLTHLREALLRHVPLSAANLHAMPVEAIDLAGAALEYQRELQVVGGEPPLLDLVHLGLGSDGHTASLVPGDPSLDVRNADVAVTGPYQGHRRMTLTYPTIDRARRVLWVVTGTAKTAVLHRLLAGDRGIPAGHVCRERAIVLADRDAVGERWQPGTGYR